ncbi:hypothetical protein IEQ34_007835 [Dendrobium chrysotoxum]|uniref:SCY1-like protein 2 n=1 Tax=Dendrobium chrysotoxum TaxID=161865 RepID=A0AAV7H6P1_DENCH|nr:hypothetical protein IEQ34_007835 [Dendrobium chrysotoxum]
MLELQPLTMKLQDIELYAFGTWLRELVMHQQLGSSFFRDDTRLRALRFLDHMLERDNMQKTEFLKALSDMWKDFDARILRYKVLPPLCAELRNVVMQPMILPMVLTIAKSQDKNDFELSTLPALVPVLTSASGETLLLLVKHADLLVDKATQEHLLSHVLPLLVRAYDDSDPRTQEEVLRRTLTLARQLDMQLVKQAILPRVHGLALRTTVAAVRVNALRCLGDLVPSLDRQAVLDILQTLQRCTTVDHSAPTLMCTLGVLHAIYKQYGLEFAAEHVLPQVFPLLMAQQLSVQQFAKYMLFVKDILRKIEEKRGVTLAEYGTSEARVSPSLSNELHSGPYQKQCGSVQDAKKTTAWDEDWGPINRQNTSASGPLASNWISKQSVSASQAISTIPLQSSMAAVNQQITSISPVDVQWPPPYSSSVFVSQSVTNDKMNLNSGGTSSRTFDDINPFANWPPRPSGSSSYMPNNNGRSISSDGFGTHNFDFSSNNNVVGSKPYQESVPSINNNQSSLNKIVSGNTPDSLSLGLGQPIVAKANLGIGSIFVSANSTRPAAPKLAPPPLTAIGRGRGRNQVSLSSQTKPSSEQSPILDLL